MFVTNIIIVIIIIIIIYIHPLLNYTKLPRISLTRISKLNQPIVVYRTWKNNYVDKKMFKNCHQRWLDLNNNIRMEWFDNYDCDKYMKSLNPILYNCYKKIKAPAFKADLFRLCILYERGGMYVDGHTMPYVSIKEMIKGCKTDNLFVSVLDSKYSSSGIHNGLIISCPKHPFLKECISRIVKNVTNSDYTNHVLALTGPLCLSRAINTVLKRKEDALFTKGKNEYGNLSFYLYEFEYGPWQYIYKDNKVIVSKKHCLISYLLDKLKSSSYTNMWKNKIIY